MRKTFNRAGAVPGTVPELRYRTRHLVLADSMVLTDALSLVVCFWHPCVFGDAMPDGTTQSAVAIVFHL
jgi:hypothetical protein